VSQDVELITHDGLSRRLTGGSCVNQRSLKAAAELFGPVASGNRPLPLSELLEALWLLELLVVSRGVSYDGTLPAADLRDLQADLEVLSNGGRLKSGFFRGVEPRDLEEQLDFISSSAAVALHDMTHGGKRPVAIEGLDKPLPAEDARVFFEKLSALAKESRSHGGTISRKRLLELLGESYRGSKCVVGIAGLGSAGIENAVELGQRLTGPQAGGLLINRFRFSYVRQLSFGAGDVYVPARRWKDLSRAHAITLKEVARKYFQEHYAADTSEHLREALNAKAKANASVLEVALPPIGLYVLMSSPDSAGPKDILANALDMQSSYGAVFRKYWERTTEVEVPEEGWVVLTGDSELDRYAENIERVLSDKFGDLRGQALGTKKGGASLLEGFATPIYTVGLGALGAVLGVTLVSSTVGPALAAGAGAAFGAAVQLMLDAGKNTFLSHLDQYRQLDAELMRAYAQVLRIDRLESKVSTVFGRKLLIE